MPPGLGTQGRAASAITRNSVEEGHTLLATLDCETLESTYESVQDLCGMNRGEVNGLLDALDLDACSEDDPRRHWDTPSRILSLFEDKIGRTVPFDEVHWFHLTRASQDTDFADGILPLRQCIDRIWDFLFSLPSNVISSDEWTRFRNEMERNLPGGFAELYRMKVSDRLHWGPYGILIKEAAFVPMDLGNHDYLRTPEIIEDICECFREKSGIPLIDEFLAHTTPCVVKFKDHRFDRSLLGDALLYLYYKRCQQDASPPRPSCFDGQGVAVPRERILDVEFVPQGNSG